MSDNTEAEFIRKLRESIFGGLGVPKQYLNETSNSAQLVKLEREALRKQYLEECKECGGSGFSKPGTGYNSVCDECGGKGEVLK